MVGGKGGPHLVPPDLGVDQDAVQVEDDAVDQDGCPFGAGSIGTALDVLGAPAAAFAAFAGLAGAAVENGRPSTPAKSIRANVATSSASSRTS